MSKNFIADNGKEFETGEHNFISGEIHVEVNELIERDLESTLDLFSERLIGSELLTNTSYKVSGTHDGKISLIVTGQIDMVLDYRGSTSPTP